MVNEDQLLVVGDLEAARTGVLINDSADSILALLVSPPSHGTLTLNPNGSFVYSPTGNFNGADSFEYKTSNGTKESAAATVTITVNSVVDPPVANAQSVTTSEDYPKAIALTGTAGDGPSLTYIVVTGPTHGTLTGTAPTLTYTPAANYNGPDSFTFQVNDGVGSSNVATVSITVTAVNDKPVAVNDSYSTNQGVALTIAVPGVLGNDTDADGNDVPPPPALTAGSLTQPASGKGTVALNANGSFTYTPPASFTGVATFTYKANDGTASSLNAATVTITVNAVGYELVNVKNLPPAAGVKFKPSIFGTLVEFKWQFSKLGSVVASSDAQPSVTITGPNGYNLTFTPANCGPFGFTFEYNSSAKKWEFNWKPKNAALGTYYVVVRSGKTGQSFPATGGFPVVFSNY